MTGDEVCTMLAALGQTGIHGPRLLVVLAHQDDETIALGGRMDCLETSRFVCATDGAPLDANYRDIGYATPREYSFARQQELEAVMRHARLPPECAVPLTVEGRRLSDKRAREALVPLTHALVREMVEFQPDAVLTHPYEGGHPDHDACAFAVQAASRLMASQDGVPAIPVVEAPFYHRSAHGFTTGAFAFGDTGVEAPLLAWQAASKRARFGLFRSQAQTLARFGFGPERYRLAPRYNFAQPPHAGVLNYEDFGWGMTGAEFCTFASEAQRTLGL